MSWVVVLGGIVAVLALIVLIGVVRSLLRLVIALVAGLMVPALVYWIASTFGLGESIPLMAYLALGLISMLGVLFGD